MFTRAWIYLALVLIPLGLMFDVRSLLVISAFLLTIVPAARAWNNYSLRHVVFERSFGERRAFPGETVALTLRVSNQKLLPLGWLVLEDEWPLATPPTDGSLFPSILSNVGHVIHALSVRPFERVQRNYQIHCTRRGFFAFGPVRMRSGDIFGLFRTDREFSDLDWLIVYPQVLPLDSLGFPPKEPFGEIKATWRMFEDPGRPIGVRDHQPEDSFRDIHWKATARRQDLQVKVYEPATSFNLVIFLNVATFEKPWQGLDPRLLEQAISVAASIASYGFEHKYLVGLVANGSIPHSDQPLKVLPSRRPDQLARLLEALAAVTGFATRNIESLLTTESARLPWGATLVVVTGVVTEGILASLLRLRDEGRRIVLVSLAERALPEELTGIRAYHLPASSLPFDDSWLPSSKAVDEDSTWGPAVAPPVRLTGRLA
jgi:uncharacterized protein (DUF58 family)